MVLTSTMMVVLTDQNSTGQWAFPNQDLYETFDRLDLNKDGFIDQAEQERELRVQEMTESVRANLQRLENMSKAGLTEQQLESIFGVAPASKSCPKGAGWKCVGKLSTAIIKCIPHIITGQVAKCVGNIVGAGNRCLGCLCWVLSLVTPWSC